MLLMMNGLSRVEMRQRLDLCIRTYYNIYGEMPTVTELYRELGNEYAPVLMEYVSDSQSIAG